MKKCMESFWTRTAKDKKLKKQAFTLVEILIVVAVIGILFVALVPRIDFAGDKARETGVKTDFRSFELAAEQYLREKGGVSEIASVADLCGNGAINMYLDNAMQFETTGDSTKADPWNQEYSVQIIKPSSVGNTNNGAIVFVCNGKDSLKSADSDNYVLVVTYVDGQIESETTGFSSNIESDNITISAADASSMTISSGSATITYKKN
ncbi:MAG: type II secretion system GspH family protein [Firmicutes bacterium]|nr:type II secretion system GspH family protein [Bacillota bacterium]